MSSSWNISGFNWSTNSEIVLFKAILEHKPAGISKHFKMACLLRDLYENMSPEDTKPTPDQIWKFLAELYNLDNIDELEMSCETDMLKENDFFLPDGTYSRLMHAREEESMGGNKRRKRRDSGDTVSSRASTPANRTSDTSKRST